MPVPSVAAPEPDNSPLTPLEAAAFEHVIPMSFARKLIEQARLYGTFQVTLHFHEHRLRKWSATEYGEAHHAASRYAARHNGKEPPWKQASTTTT